MLDDWEILWALILGFTLSARVQAVIRKSTVVRLMGDDRPARWRCRPWSGRRPRRVPTRPSRWIGSTNLVVEPGVILALLLGWQFTLAEFVGGPLMIVGVAVLFRLFVRRRLVDAALAQAERGLAGSMAGHAAVDMSVQGEGSFLRRRCSGDGFTSVAHVFVMEWAAVWGPIVGPVVAILAFVCSIGNVPLAAVLWNGGISFGGYLVELLFGASGLIPAHRHAMVMSEGLSWNYTTWLNIVFLLLAAVLVVRFVRTGGIPMLAMMGGGPDAEEQHEPGHSVTDPGQAPTSPPPPDTEVPHTL